jgi:hypothetical protein
MYVLFSYSHLCFYIYVLERILNKVSFSQSFFFISRTCLALIIIETNIHVKKYIVFKHRLTYAVFQLAGKPSERINRVSRGLDLLHSISLLTVFAYRYSCTFCVLCHNNEWKGKAHPGEVMFDLCDITLRDFLKKELWLKSRSANFARSGSTFPQLLL